MPESASTDMTAAMNAHRAGFDVAMGFRYVRVAADEVVMEYEKPQLDPKDPDGKSLIKDGKLILEGGYIALQAESHPVEFRKVEIQVLKE